MSQPVLIEPKTLDVDRLMLIVVGAHLRAEVMDRPAAYRLRDRIQRWIDERARRDARAEGYTAPIDGSGGTSPRGLEVVVCSDLWYLNNVDLMARPTIAVGAPGVNAAAAYMAGRVPAALTLDDSLQIHLDLEYCTLWSCLWGVSAAATHSAVQLFEQRYLEHFLRRAHGEPLHDHAL